MLFTDQPTVSFENAARDPLGREHIGGRLVAAEDALLLHWEYRHNVFREEAPRTVRIDYTVIDTLVFQRTLWRWNPRLLLTLTDPAPLADVPGADTAGITLFLTGHAIKAAVVRLVGIVDFRRADAAAQRGAARLERLAREDVS